MSLTPDERLSLVERETLNTLPLLWQAELLCVSRSRLYSAPRPAREQEIKIKHSLDEWYTERPCLGLRKLVTLLAQDGLNVSRHTIRRYRAEMGLATLYPKPNLSRPSSLGHRVYPYLLRGLPIERPDQVWGVDITPIKPHVHPLTRRVLVSGSIPGLVLAAGDGLGTFGHIGAAVCAVLRRCRFAAGGARDH